MAFSLARARSSSFFSYNEPRPPIKKVIRPCDIVFAVERTRKMESGFRKETKPTPRRQVNSGLAEGIAWFSFKSTPFLEMEFPTGRKPQEATTTGDSAELCLVRKFWSNDRLARVDFDL